MIGPDQAVLAAIMLDSSVLRFAAEECQPSDFSDLRYERMFEGMLRMFAAQEPIDVITVGFKLADWDVRGIEIPELHAWITELPTAKNVAFYAKQVREESMRRQLRAAAARLVGRADASASEPGVMIAEALEDLRSLQSGQERSTLNVKTLGEVLAEADDEYDWVIPDLMERGDRLLLTGVEGGGKSTLVRQLAILSAAGIHPFTFFRIPPVKVLVLDAENSEKQWRRAARDLVQRAGSRLGSTNPADVVHLACMPRVDLTKDADLGQVHKLVDRFKPDLLCIGPLYRLIPRAINSDDDAAPLLAALDTLRDRGLAMVIEAHAGHAVGSGGERDLRPRGSAALLGWPEFGLGLRQDRKANASNRFQLAKWRGDRDQRKWPAHLARGMGDWPWTPVVQGY